MELGEKMELKNLRKQNNLTQTQLAQALNLSKNQILRYENELTPIPSNELIEMANFFNVSLDFLCNRPFNNNIGYIPENVRELVKIIISLNEQDIKEVYSFVKGYMLGKTK